MLTLLILLTLFFFNDTATTEIYTLSLHDALPICESADGLRARRGVGDGLGEHRVVVDADGVAVAVAGVEADAGRQGEAVQGAGLRGPVVGRVLGVQAGLDRVAARVWGCGVEGPAVC